MSSAGRLKDIVLLSWIMGRKYLSDYNRVCLPWRFMRTVALGILCWKKRFSYLITHFLTTIFKDPLSITCHRVAQRADPVRTFSLFAPVEEKKIHNMLLFSSPPWLLLSAFRLNSGVCLGCGDL